jgi:hypothetical protein
MSAVERVERLELDVDTRLVDLWANLIERGLDEDTVAHVAEYMRAAYARGYMDSIEEPKRGLFLIQNGYRVPRRSVR